MKIVALRTEIARLHTTPGQIVNVPVHIDHGGPNIVELETPALPGALTAIKKCTAVIPMSGVKR